MVLKFQEKFFNEFVITEERDGMLLDMSDTEKNIIIKSVDRMEVLLSEAEKAVETGAGDVLHYINNARAIGAALKVFI
jgi:hypothetical protein